jgi:hypothetical protein
LTTEVCSSPGCRYPAKFLYTWPGKSQKQACGYHADWIHRTGRAQRMTIEFTAIVPGW